MVARNLFDAFVVKFLKREQVSGRRQYPSDFPGP